MAALGVYVKLTMTYRQRLEICRDMAQSVATRPDTPEAERAAAVRRIWTYNDRLEDLPRGRR